VVNFDNFYHVHVVREREIKISDREVTVDENEDRVFVSIRRGEM